MSGFNDPFFDGMRKQTKRAGVGFALWFLFCAVCSVVLMSVMVWAIIRLVTHFA